MSSLSLPQRYLELIKSAVLNDLYPELESQLLFTVLCAAHDQPFDLTQWWEARDNQALRDAIEQSKQSGETIHLQASDSKNPKIGTQTLRNYSEYSHSMVGRKRLDHLQACVETLLQENIPGDLLEAGVWRGGCCLLMRAALAAYGVTDRTIWVADSFSGVPVSEHEHDKNFVMDQDRLPVLSVPVETVREIFERYQLLDDQVRFIEGWFKQSLTAAPVQQLALLRVDADLYESTRSVLDALYSKVVDGGWVIIDDYGVLPPCQLAVDEFREAHGIQTTWQWIDDHAIAWRRDNAQESTGID